MMNLKASVLDSERPLVALSGKQLRGGSLQSLCVNLHSRCGTPVSLRLCCVGKERLGTEEKPFMGTGGLGISVLFTLAL